MPHLRRSVVALGLLALTLLLGACRSHGRAKCVAQAPGCVQRPYCATSHQRVARATTRGPHSALVLVVVDTNRSAGALLPVPGTAVYAAAVPRPKRQASAVAALPLEGEATGRPQAAAALTDLRGRTVFSQLSPGTYTFVTRRIGYMSTVAAAEVRRGFVDTLWVYPNWAAMC